MCVRGGACVVGAEGMGGQRLVCVGGGADVVRLRGVGFGVCRGGAGVVGVVGAGVGVCRGWSELGRDYGGRGLV